MDYEEKILKAFNIMKKVKPDILQIDDKENFLSLIGVIVEAWSTKYGENPVEMLKQLTIVSMIVNKEE